MNSSSFIHTMGDTMTKGSLRHVAQVPSQARGRRRRNGLQGREVRRQSVHSACRSGRKRAGAPPNGAARGIWNDAFGRLAEKAARFFGTPQYIVGQTVAVLLWVALNSTQLHLGFAWDVYPFIALNLLFSLQ